MTRYYKPIQKDLVDDLLIEIYSTENQYKDKKYWKPILVSSILRSALLLAYSNEDIRVKYLDSFDFNSLGYTCKKVFLGVQTIIVDIIEHQNGEDEEITEERDIFNEDVMVILKRGIPVGSFYPYLTKKNVEIHGKTHTIKNLSELRKILK